ncbi:MAG: LamG-like jellyroll fold domain-containing protein [Prosthecobacter sp.]
MKTARFDDLSAEERDWLDAYLNGTIEPAAFEALQERLLVNPALRSVMRRYLALDHHLQSECAAGDLAAAPWREAEELIKVPASKPQRWRFTPPVQMAAAAAFAFLLGLAFMHWRAAPLGDNDSLATTNDREPSAEGFAVVRRLFDVAWPEPSKLHREGDTLGSETFRLASGTAEIQFYSGATMMVQGPAEIVLKSAWEAVCREGVVRMQVPPAARGFKLQAPTTEIVDLGTEFGLEVSDGKAHVEVFKGEIALHHQQEAERLVKQGAAWGLPAAGAAEPVAAGRVAFPDLGALGSQALEQSRADFERWQSHRDTLAVDPRLISFYTFDRKAPGALIPNLSLPANPESDGAVVLAESVDGRWPGLKSALEFRRPGSRVRVNVPGEFPAFTFACWVRIDSLDRWYNALFMGDGYETGEPHWQIRNDGKMMLSVMVDDTRPNPGAPNDAGFHRVYYSPPMWDISMSGQWLHLASVFDPAARTVSHYVNGERISSQVIEERFLIKTLRIGNAEIGNWGQPFREDPTFAIRNLNGRMDELAIFKAALSEAEIWRLYQDSRSGTR